MNECRTGNKYAKVQPVRLAVQIAVAAISLAIGFSLGPSLGIPKWAIAVMAVAAGMFFCGWICMFGTLQEWLRPVGRKLGLTWRIPPKIDRYLTLLRYVAPFVILPLGWRAVNARQTFYRTATGGAATETALAILGALLLLSLAVDRPFCKYICGFGATMGLASILRPLTVKRDQTLCSNCGRCDKACIMGVEVSKANNVRDPHCIDCGRCLTACAKPGALGFGFALPGKADLVALKRKYFPEGGSSGEKAGI